MKTIFQSCLVATLVAMSALPASAQNETSPGTATKAGTGNPAKAATTEEREKKLKEFREKQKQKQPSPEAIARLREELKNLPPEERAARMKEFRERQKAALASPDADPQAKMRARFENRISDLRKKKADGTITGDEAKQLERGEKMLKRPGKKSPETADRPDSNQLPVPQVPPSKKSE